jgi:hypothetical protein
MIKVILAILFLFLPFSGCTQSEKAREEAPPIMIKYDATCDEDTALVNLVNPDLDEDTQKIIASAIRNQDYSISKFFDSQDMFNLVMNESRFDQHVLGDSGKSLGLVQIQLRTITDLEEHFKMSLDKDRVWEPSYNVYLGLLTLSMLEKKTGSVIRLRPNIFQKKQFIRDAYRMGLTKAMHLAKSK